MSHKWADEDELIALPNGGWDSPSKKLKGVGPDAPTVANKDGGKQSLVPYRCDLLPPRACLAVAEVLDHGARKYGPHNWHKIPVEDHINHAMGHVFAFLAGDTTDEHLEHAACRMLMALERRAMGEDVKGGAYDGTRQKA